MPRTVPSAPFCVLAGLFLALLLAPSAGAGQLYGVSQVYDEVFVIDTTTGVATLIGAIPPGDNIKGIDFDGSGELLGIDGFFSEQRMWSLDADAGVGTFIGWTGMDDHNGCLARDPNTGIFYSHRSWGAGTFHQLVTVDTTTGISTPLWLTTGDTPDPNGFAGMTFLPDGTLLAYDPTNTGDSSLYSIDTATGVATQIGDTGDDPLSIHGGLAYDPDTDTLYMSNAAELWAIDPSTGVGTFIGNHGLTDDLMNGLAVLPDPVLPCLLGVDLTSTLWDIDPWTGAGSNPRPMGASKFGGLALSPTGELFGTRAAPIPELYSIDIPTGLPTLIGPLDILHEEGGLDFDPTSGELYGVGGTSDLFVIDTTTGAATLVGPLVDELGDPIDPSAMAFDDAGALFVLKASSTPPEIYQVDATDGTVFDRVPLPGLPYHAFAGMDFDDTTGTLRLVYADLLYEANPYTGDVDLMGVTPPLMSALEVAGSCDPPTPPRIWRARRMLATGGPGG